MKRVVLTGGVILTLAGAPLSQAVAADQPIYDTSMATPVESLPLKPTRFTLTESRQISRIRTFHWNRGRGAEPGSIALQRRDKTLLGPWKATGAADDTGLANAWWQVEPGIELPAGSYTLLDSDPASWSRNPARGNMGIATIFGSAPKADAVAAPTQSTEAAQQTTVGTADVVRGAAESAPLSLQAQQQLAAELFEQIIQSDRFDYEKIEALYLRVINECPDSDRTEEAYFRLSNLYRMGFDPPEHGKLRFLLESFLERFPDSEGQSEMSERLLRAYENTGQWAQVVSIYDQSVPNLPNDHPYLLVSNLDYARALEGAGERERALEVYRKVAAIAGGERAGEFDMSDLWLRAANDRIAQIERIRQQRWPEVIAAYRKQFEGMAWAEMPQIQELLEYAQALETDGDSKNAVTQYRQVLRTDRENGTRQARIARERLQALGADG